MQFSLLSLGKDTSQYKEESQPLYVQQVKKNLSHIGYINKWGLQLVRNKLYAIQRARRMQNNE